MPWTFYNSNGQRLSTSTTLIDNLDIDGATDIGAAIVDADLFIVDDGAGGTNRKTAASRIVTYVGANTDTRSGVLKVWVRWESQGTHSIDASYNMTSVSDGGGAGDSDLLFATDFSSVNYALAGNTHYPLVIGTSGTPAAGGVTIAIWNSSDEVMTDASRIFLQCAGAQA